MRIMIYQPRVSYYIGGGEIYPLQIAKFFSKMGHDVSILTTKAKYIKQSEYFKNFVNQNKNIHIEYLELDLDFKNIYEELPGMNQQRWDKESLWVARKAYEFFLKNHYDIISVHYVLDALAIPFNCKGVLHLHGAPKQISDLCKIVLEKQKNLIAVSQVVKTKWLDLGVKSNIEISTNAIDENIFYPKVIFKDIDVLFVGRLIEIKGVQYLLKALKKLQKKGLYPKLVIIGDGPFKKELLKLVNNLQIKNQIKFCGIVSQEMLVRSYQSAKCVVLPSYEKEGIMSTLLEAAACRLPIITTKGTSMAEFAGVNRNALLVNPCDADDLCDKIYTILTNDKLADRISNNAYDEVISHYSWISKSKELIDLYKRF